MPEQLPVWNNPGIEPSTDLKVNGWQPGQKPSAQHFNWLFNRAYKCLEELQGDSAKITELEQTLTELEQTVTLNNEKFNEHLADSVKHVSQNEKDVWNNKLDKTGGTLTGNLAIHKGIPALIFGVPGRENDTRLFWNASTTNDFGLVFRVDGADALTLKSNKTIVDGNQRPVYTGTSVTVSQTPPQGTLANDAIHMVY